MINLVLRSNREPLFGALVQSKLTTSFIYLVVNKVHSKIKLAVFKDVVWYAKIQTYHLILLAVDAAHLSTHKSSLSFASLLTMKSPRKLAGGSNNDIFYSWQSSLDGMARALNQKILKSSRKQRWLNISKSAWLIFSMSHLLLVVLVITKSKY